MLKIIKQQLQSFPVGSHSPTSQAINNTAAVMIILHGDADDPKLVLTQRAAHLNKHAGEVAFPGGMWEKSDRDLLHTALRETEEEIGLSSNLITPIAMLPTRSPKTSDVKVYPFVGLADSPLTLTPQASEIAAIFDLPIICLTEIDRYNYFAIGSGAEKVELPYFPYKNFKIWGFTLHILVDMLNKTLNADIRLRYPDPAKLNRLRQKQKS